MFGRYSAVEDLPDIVLNLPSCLGSQVIRCWIIFEVELRPDNEVNNLLVDAIWPVIVEYLEVTLRYVSK